ncbi:hypothetical protein [Cupriavidus basilensis]
MQKRKQRIAGDLAHAQYHPGPCPAPFRRMITRFGCLITYFGNVITRFGIVITDFGVTAK